MPLKSGSVGSKAFGENIATELAAGKPKKQAVAIAYATARKDSDPHRLDAYFDAVRRGDSDAMRNHFKSKP